MTISISQYLEKLPLQATEKWPEGVWDIEAFNHGTMSLVLFAPEGKDYQTPHDQDELYIVIEGEGTLDIEGELNSFTKGDALFVPAHKEHKFIKYTQGTKMWAIFWGTVGGEKNA